MARVKCSYCGSTINIENEHARAKVRGGVSTIHACMACNRSKGAKTQAQWLDDLKKTNYYRWKRIVDEQKRKRSPFANLVRRRR